jgi:hypothetical protein
MSDAMFHHNLMLSKSFVVSFILWGAWLATRLPPGMGCQTSRVQGFHPLISRIAPRANALRQIIQHTTLFEQREIRLRARHTLQGQQRAITIIQPPRMACTRRSYPIRTRQMLCFAGFEERFQLIKQVIELRNRQPRHTTKYPGMLAQMCIAYKHGWLSLRYWFICAFSLPVSPLFANPDLITAQLYSLYYCT